jgi:hypothetical protein
MFCCPVLSRGLAMMSRSAVHGVFLKVYWVTFLGIISKSVQGPKKLQWQFHIETILPPAQTTRSCTSSRIQITLCSAWDTSTCPEHISSVQQNQIRTALQTNSVEHSPWEANSRSASQEIRRLSKKPEGSLLRSQEPVTSGTLCYTS